ISPLTELIEEQYETGGWDDHWTIGEFSHAVRSGLGSAANESGVADAVADRLIGRGRIASWGTTRLSVLGWLHGETWIAAGAAAEGMHTSQMLMIRALYAPGPLSNGLAQPEKYNSRGECETTPSLLKHWKELDRYDRYWQRHAPKWGVPGTRVEHVLINRAGRMEYSTVVYDEYGRQSLRVDYTDHMRPESHTNPHLHETTYGPGTVDGHTVQYDLD
ncbi:MAG: hypothetical protein SXV54_13200, partial [Chloroflexota bacterium]|nr:hypothetical protein [Chloroflexota bacterium]